MRSTAVRETVTDGEDRGGALILDGLGGGAQRARRVESLSTMMASRP